MPCPIVSTHTVGGCSTGGISKNRFEHRGLKHATTRPSATSAKRNTQQTKLKKTQGVTQVQATVRCKALLLLVWIAQLVEVQYKLEEAQCELVLRNLSSNGLPVFRYWLFAISLSL